MFSVPIIKLSSASSPWPPCVPFHSPFSYPSVASGACATFETTNSGAGTGEDVVSGAKLPVASPSKPFE